MFEVIGMITVAVGVLLAIGWALGFIKFGPPAVQAEVTAATKTAATEVENAAKNAAAKVEAEIKK